jgi:hypothetical protein
MAMNPAPSGRPRPRVEPVSLCRTTLAAGCIVVLGLVLSASTAAVQAAMDAGKPTVYFPSRQYRTEGEIRVPPTVRRINGLFHAVHMVFAVRGDEARLAGSERGSRLLIRRCPDRPGQARNVFLPLLVSAVQARK